MILGTTPDTIIMVGMTHIIIITTITTTMAIMTHTITTTHRITHRITHLTTITMVEVPAITT